MRKSVQNTDLTPFPSSRGERGNYYPFGSSMVSFSNTEFYYSYGFNGMEKDNELKGEGNSYTTEFRQLDTRLGRWFSVDPLAKLMPYESSYVFVGNSPMIHIDPDGRKRTVTHIYNNYKTVTDKETGKTTLVKTGVTKIKIVKNDDLISVQRSVDRSSSPDTYNVYDWYDINETITHTVIDGKERSKTTEITKGTKRTTTFFNVSWYAKEKVKDREFGGVNWTSSNGQGQESRSGKGKINSENIDILLAALGSAITAAQSSKSDKFIDAVKYLVDVSSTVDGFQSNNVTVEDAINKLKGGKAGVTHCNTCKTNHEKDSTGKIIDYDSKKEALDTAENVR
jgi:RHS repeat-associated protein